ncbi:hypothetical protein GCM10011345_35500 [Gemmobacter megaterium]|nr:hypothetical protein GCM10011345_35500 [Gemmobacter megaterium]
MCVSMHKAGSTITDSILLDFMNAKGMEIDRISLLAPKSAIPVKDLYVQYQEKMKLDGVYYGVARGPFVSQMPILKNMKIIMQVRDPRDCITSAYFSFKTSHVPPKDPAKLQEFMERRKKLEEMDIDQYAVAEAGGYKHRLSILKKLMDGHNDILLLKYEDMVTQTPKWLNQISEFIDQPITDELRTTLGDKVNFSVPKEDESKHKRQVLPGDHMRKLKPDTIRAMSERMADELGFFGYAMP